MVEPVRIELTSPTCKAGILAVVLRSLGTPGGNRTHVRGLEHLLLVLSRGLVRNLRIELRSPGWKPGILAAIRITLDPRRRFARRSPLYKSGASLEKLAGLMVLGDRIELPTLCM